MLRIHRRHVVSRKRSIVPAGVLFVVAGCAPLPREPAAVPPPPLQLLGADPLELPDGCEPVAGRVYRTSYVVLPDGRVTDAAAGSGEGCVEVALRAWVGSFRYGPIDSRTSAVIDWIAVTARRGG
jgi:hypothetical protein